MAAILATAIGVTMIRILRAPNKDCEKVALDAVQTFRRDYPDHDSGVENAITFDVKAGSIFRSQVYQANVWWTKNRSISVEIIDPTA